MNFQDRMAVILSDHYPDFAAFGRILHRIVEKVHDGLSEDGPVSCDDYIVVSVYVDALVPLLRQHFKKLHCFIGQIEQVNLN